MLTIAAAASNLPLLSVAPKQVRDLGHVWGDL